MNYKKEIYDNYTLHLIKSDKFKTVDVSVRLTKPFDKNEFAYLKLLEKIIRFNSTKKYKDITEISKELERLYNSNLMVKTYKNKDKYKMVKINNNTDLVFDNFFIYFKKGATIYLNNDSFNLRESIIGKKYE